MEVLKEYLVEAIDGKFVYFDREPYVGMKFIEIPEGAELFFRFTDQKVFVKFCDEGWASIYLNGQWEESEIWNKDDLINDRPDRILWQRPTLPEALPFISDGYNPFGYGGGEDDTDGHYRTEPPPYYGNAIRPKPRMRMYAGIGRKVINVTIQIPAPVEHITFTGTVFEPVDDDCIRVPKASADYLFNTVQTLGFVSKDQKESVLHHLNYLRVY